VPGLKFINKLKPVTYHLDVTRLSGFLKEDERAARGNNENMKSIFTEAIKIKEQIAYTGFVAQEVEVAAKAIGYDFSGVDVPKNEYGLYGLRYAEFVMPLVKAVQELDEIQNSRFKTQNEEIAKLKEENMELRERLAKLENMMIAQVTSR
jgi:hypothetical protein